MAKSAEIDRKAVRKFFTYRLKAEAQKREVNSAVVNGWAWFGAIAGGVALGASDIHEAAWLGGAIAGAVLFGLLAYLVQRGQVSFEFRAKKKEREQSEKELAELARKVRATQRHDIEKAFLRIFQRACVNRSELRLLEEVYRFEQERSLLDEESQDEIIGDLANKSIRLFSQGDYTNQYQRTINWTDLKRQEQFYNPIRLVVIFMTRQQFVICDVQIDSVDGDLSEEIQKISFSKVVNLAFSAKRIRHEVSQEQIIAMAKDLGHSDKEIEDIRESFSSGEDGPVGDAWVYERMVSELTMTRSDGGRLTIPIRDANYFGQHKGALDDASGLSADEIVVDRMMNELNRLITTA